MAKMEWQESESELSAQSGQEFHVKLTALALGLAIAASAEAQTLRQMLKDADIELDNKAFNTQTLVFMDGIVATLKKNYPDLAHAIPTIQSLVEAGRINLD